MAGRGRGRGGTHASNEQVMSPTSLPPASPLSSVSDVSTSTHNPEGSSSKGI